MKGGGLTLQHAQLLQAYRSAIRITRRRFKYTTLRALPDAQTRRETLDYLRSDLERLRLTTDLGELRNALSTFQRSLKTLGPSLGLTGLDGRAKLIGRRTSPW